MPRRRPPLTGTEHTLPFSKLSPRDFERLCLWLVRHESYNCVEHVGAAGSDQGLDIVAWRGSLKWGFQCKQVQRFGPKTALKEIEKVIGLPETERPAVLVFMVSCDVSLQTRTRTRARCAGTMECRFWSGTELDAMVKLHPGIVSEFFQVDSAEMESLGRNMSEKLAELRVFVGSPRDVLEERGRLRRVIDELNQSAARDRGFVLRLVGTETSVRPDVGVYPQEVVNRQVGSCHIFVGIMWRHFGTPTPQAGSGTEEEFDQAYSLFLERGQPRILFYFSEAPFFPSSQEETQQLQEVLAFRRKLSEKGVFFCKYNGPEAFERAVRQHLTDMMRDWEEDAKRAEMHRAIVLGVLRSSKDSTLDDLATEVCGLVSEKVPNASVCLYICDGKDPCTARRVACSSVALAARLRQSWCIPESPFVEGVNVGVGRYLVLETRNSGGRLEGFLVLERLSVKGTAAEKFDQADHLWLSTLAQALGDKLLQQRE